MKFIKPSFEILKQGPTINDMYKHITRCGYTCYKTEKEITDDSAKAFVKKMKENKHHAMLEHGTVTLSISDKTYKVSPAIRKKVEFLISNHLWTQWFRMPNLEGKWCIFIITNYRVIVENNLEDFMKDFWFDNKHLSEMRPCVKIITDIGVGRELTRHRVFSFAQESTRYCNYSSDKFNNELTFIEPNFEIANDEKGYFLNTLQQVEDDYLHLISKGWKPQQARAVLPLCLKTEIIMTGFLSDWEHFFDLRVFDKTGPAHPDMKAIATPIYSKFVEDNIIIKKEND